MKSRISHFSPRAYPKVMASDGANPVIYFQQLDSFVPAFSLSVAWSSPLERRLTPGYPLLACSIHRAVIVACRPSASRAPTNRQQIGKSGMDTKADDFPLESVTS